MVYVNALCKLLIVYTKYLWAKLPLFYEFSHCPYRYYILCFTHILKIGVQYAYISRTIYIARRKGLPTHQ